MGAVEGLDLSVVAHGMKAVPPRPQDDLDPTLTRALERFANGAGRYEHLDSLWDDQADVATLKTSTELCGRVTPPQRLRDLISLRNIVVERMRRLSNYGHLEGTTYGLLESLDPFLPELSSAVALRLYDKAGWVAATLDALIYHTRQELPLLGEAVLHIKPPAEAFFRYSVAQIDDEQATMKDLESHFVRRSLPLRRRRPRGADSPRFITSSLSPPAGISACCVRRSMREGSPTKLSVKLPSRQPLSVQSRLSER